MTSAGETAGRATAATQDFGRRHPLAPIGLGVLLYSIGPVFVQASSVTGAVFSLWRLWFGVGVFGLAYLVHRRLGGAAPSRRAWGYAAAAGVAFGCHQLLLFSAIKATSVADVTLVNTLSPVVTAIMALPVFGERPGTVFRAWSIVAMAGAGVVVVGASAGPSGDPVGMALALANVVAFAVFFLLSKISRDDLGVVAFLLGTMTLAALFVSAYVAVTDDAALSAGRTDLLYAFVVAAGPGALGHVVMTWPLRWVPANVPPVMRLGIPLFAATWAWWWLGESVSWWHLAGGALTLVGVAGAVLAPSGRRFRAQHRDGASASSRT